MWLTVIGGEKFLWKLKTSRWRLLLELVCVRQWKVHRTFTSWKWDVDFFGNLNLCFSCRVRLPVGSLLKNLFRFNSWFGFNGLYHWYWFKGWNTDRLMMNRVWSFKLLINFLFYMRSFFIRTPLFYEFRNF